MTEQKKKKTRRKYKKRPLTEYVAKKSMSTLSKTKEIIEFELRLNALEMKKAGCPYAEIADVLEISPSKASALVKKSLTQLYEMEGDFAKEYRELQLLRLEQLLKSVWALATSKVPDYNAIDRALKIIDQQARVSGLTQAITNNVFNFNPVNIDNRELTIVEAEERSKKLQTRLEAMRESLVIDVEVK